jgi:phosphopantetheinyl transferase (holo-ACP synthase)
VEKVRSCILSARNDRVQRLALHPIFSLSLPIPTAVVWLDGPIADTQEGRQKLAEILTPTEADRILPAITSQDSTLRRRGLSAAHDRLALHNALAELTQRQTPNAHRLSHTSLGQPIFLEPEGLASQMLHVSFTHDGDAHLCALAHSSAVAGVGIDVVHLPRLRGRSDEYFHRFARHFMSDAEYAAFRVSAEGECGEPLLRRVAAHFSLMESASKALGTGLKIGAGMGTTSSLPKQSIGVSQLEPEVRWLLGDDANDWIDFRWANHMAGHWSANEEYAVSIALLLRMNDGAPVASSS